MNKLLIGFALLSSLFGALSVYAKDFNQPIIPLDSKEVYKFTGVVGVDDGSIVNSVKNALLFCVSHNFLHADVLETRKVECIGLNGSHCFDGGRAIVERIEVGVLPEISRIEKNGYRKLEIITSLSCY